MNKVKKLHERCKLRVRLKIRHSAALRPRLSVFRSSKHIYAQVIDDAHGRTLAAASSLEQTGLALAGAAEQGLDPLAPLGGGAN